MIFTENHCLGHIDLNFSLSINKIQHSFLRSKNKKYSQYLSRSIPVMNDILSKGGQDELGLKEVIL